MQIKFHVRQDGQIVIRWPKGAMPDKQTIERLYQAIRANGSNKEAVA